MVRHLEQQQQQQQRSQLTLQGADMPAAQKRQPCCACWCSSLRARPRPTAAPSVLVLGLQVCIARFPVTCLMVPQQLLQRGFDPLPAGRCLLALERPRQPALRLQGAGKSLLLEQLQGGNRAGLQQAPATLQLVHKPYTEA